MADEADYSVELTEETIQFSMKQHAQMMAARRPCLCPMCEEEDVMTLVSGCFASLCARCWLEEHPGMELPRIKLDFSTCN